MSPLAQMIQLIVLTSLALGAVYFIFYRPTVDAQNRQRRVVAGLQPGDEVVTTSGFLARLVDVDQLADGSEVLVLDLGDGRTVRARPGAIAERLPRNEPEAEIAEEPLEAAAAAAEDGPVTDDTGASTVPAGRR